MIAVTCIVALIGILLPAVGMVRTSSKKHTAAEVISQLSEAMVTYRQDDPRHRFPMVNGDGTLSVLAIPGPGQGALAQLSAIGLYFGAEQRRDDATRLLDPWSRPYQFDVARPSVALPAGALSDWNWDATAAHEREWGLRPDPVTTVVAAGPLLHPYIWSLGTAGDRTNATTWIYPKDKR